MGKFPLVTYENAQRRSKNRLAGTEVVKPIASITRDVIREFMVHKVLPAIWAKWPREDVNQPIYIQQDNAPSHLEVNDPVFCEAAKQEGLDIHLICQPPNSPDFNILDLGSIQSIQYKKQAKTVEGLIPTVQEVNWSLVHLFNFIVSSTTDLFIFWIFSTHVGIPRALSTQSKHDLFNTSECFEGNHEG